MNPGIDALSMQGHGLLDRRGNPRTAFWRLAAMAREG